MLAKRSAAVVLAYLSAGCVVVKVIATVRVPKFVVGASVKCPKVGLLSSHAMMHIPVPLDCSVPTTTRTNVFVSAFVELLPNERWSVLWEHLDLFVEMVRVAWADFARISVIPRLFVLHSVVRLTQTVPMVVAA